jgi:hypothetical protein
MAKTSNGKGANTGTKETKALRAPVRRKTERKTTAAIAQSPDMNTSGPGLETAEHEPSREEIQRLAYDLYVRRGGQHGGDLDDWFEAERRLRRATLH